MDKNDIKKRHAYIVNCSLGMYVGVCIFKGGSNSFNNPQVLFRFPQLRGSLHNGGFRLPAFLENKYTDHSLYWVSPLTVIAEVKQGGYLI